jgi:hypothetical protein
MGDIVLVNTVGNRCSAVAGHSCSTGMFPRYCFCRSYQSFGLFLVEMGVAADVSFAPVLPTPVVCSATNHCCWLH